MYISLNHLEYFIHVTPHKCNRLIGHFLYRTTFYFNCPLIFTLKLKLCPIAWTASCSMTSSLVPAKEKASVHPQHDAALWGWCPRLILHHSYIVLHLGQKSSNLVSRMGVNMFSLHFPYFYLLNCVSFSVNFKIIFYLAKIYKFKYSKVCNMKNVKS